LSTQDNTQLTTNRTVRIVVNELSVFVGEVISDEIHRRPRANR